MTRTRSLARPDVLAVAALLGCQLVYFWPWVTLRTVFYQVDVAFMDHPLRVHAFEMIRSGWFPFWSDSILCGLPVFAEGQAAVLYPLSWLYFFLAPSTALNAFVVVHYATLGLGCYAFLRTQPLRPAASLFGALTLVFSSFMVVEHVLLGFLSVAAWTPVLLWLQLRFLRRGRPANLVLAGLVVAVQHLAGSPLETLVALTLAACFALAAPGMEGAATWPRRLAAAALPASFGSLLAAPQLLATLEFLAESTRAAGTLVPRDRFLPSAGLVTLVFPRFLGLPTDAFVGPVVPGWEETLLLYVGWSPLVLAVLGLGRQGATRFWLILCMVALALCLEPLHPVSRLLWSIPPLSVFRWPARVLFWYAIGMSVLAAHGYQQVCGPSVPEAARAWRWRLVVLAGLGVAVTATFLAFRGGLIARPLAPGELERLAALRDQDYLAFTACGLALLAVAAARGFRFRRTALGLLAFAILALGVGVNVRPDGVPPDVYEREPTTAQAARTAQGDHGRMLALTAWASRAQPIGARAMRRRIAELPANAHLLFGLRAAGQFDVEGTATLRRNRAFLAPPEPQLLDPLAVNAVVPRAGEPWPDTGAWSVSAPGGGDALVAVRRTPLSRAFLAEDFVVIADEVARERRIQDPGARLRETVVLERAPAWPASKPAAAGVAAARVEFVRDEPGRVELRVEAPRDALLVLADSYYPGWQASVDGVEVETYVANGFVRAVAVPAGRHAVAFVYRPRSLRLGLALTLGALLLAVPLLARRTAFSARSGAG